MQDSFGVTQEKLSRFFKFAGGLDGLISVQLA
jgi:hypothetical protein